ncbi:MAG: polymer-forming cytoskeletal protein [Thermodesulfobacteriota bacterium]|nr:polymer-forming cytoskeletal protein [Thermodesulfobacteriota bacterium]
MFFKKKKSKEQTVLPLESTEEVNKVAYLGKDLSIKGVISGQDDIQINGKFEGDLKLKGRLDIEQSATIKGSAVAKTMYVKGRVNGRLAAVSKMFIDRTAKINGKLFTPVISVVEGAQFNGEVKMVD